MVCFTMVSLTRQVLRRTRRHHWRQVRQAQLRHRHVMNGVPSTHLLLQLQAAQPQTPANRHSAQSHLPQIHAAQPQVPANRHIAQSHLLVQHVTLHVPSTLQSAQSHLPQVHLVQQVTQHVPIRRQKQKAGHQVSLVQHVPSRRQKQKAGHQVRKTKSPRFAAAPTMLTHIGMCGAFQGHLKEIRPSSDRASQHARTLAAATCLLWYPGSREHLQLAARELAACHHLPPLLSRQHN